MQYGPLSLHPLHIHIGVTKAECFDGARGEVNADRIKGHTVSGNGNTNLARGQER